MSRFNSWPTRRKLESSKRDHGNLLLVAGSARMPGAASLAALGAIRSGIGLLTLASVPEVIQIAAARITETLLLPLPEIDGALDQSASSKLAVEAWDAAVFGPGLSTQRSVLEFLSQTWSKWCAPCVIDADALNAVAMGVEIPACQCVMTPHEGEIARLLKVDIERVKADRPAAVRAAAAEFGCCVVLKGHQTLVSNAGEDLYLNQTGNPGMATGGMGDVLSGVIGTLLAQKLETFEAAKIGVYWHGAAGDLCAKRIGPYGYTATEVANSLPQVLIDETEDKN